MKEKIIGDNIRRTMMGSTILAILPMDDCLGIALDNDLGLCLFHESFWRVLNNDKVTASSKNLFVRCGYEDTSWPDHFPPSIQGKVDEMEDYDAEVVTAYLETHIDKQIAALKELLEGKTVSDVFISSCGDIDIIVSSDIRIQAYSSFPDSDGEYAYRLEKG